tara:strand:+ start:14 stop:361 length:348 start_codon:yes stop_codon:yes gene_type:complete
MNITPIFLLYFAFIIFFGYLVIAILRYINTLDFIKKNFGNLEQFFELTFAVAILYIIFYPYWFIALAKDAFIGSNKPEEYYKPSRFAFIGVHIPLLLCWSAFWLYVINLILDNYF